IILIDARYGVQTQTRRHSYITSLLGIKHIVVAVNKMDLVNFSEQRFNEIKEQYQAFAKDIGIVNPVFIPVSALTGDNVVNISENMPWNTDAPLMEQLDTIPLEDTVNLENFRLPVQYVNRPHLDFRGFCGTIAAGTIKVGDAVTVLPSNKTSIVKQVIQPAIGEENMEIAEAFAPMAITLTLEDEVDISRGDMIVKTNDLPAVSSKFEVKLVWMNETAMQPGVDYLIKRSSNVVPGRFEAIDHKIDVNSLEKVDASELQLNEIAQCQLSLKQVIAFDAYADVKGTGSFIVIDKYTHATLAAGMILSKSDNEHNASTRVYSDEDKALNEMIRTKFPEWGCRSIDEL
ncbi:MAG: sulfate adenylyltransferase subunit CysN, partial [Piscirickettsiaceae bacterium]